MPRRKSNRRSFSEERQSKKSKVEEQNNSVKLRIYNQNYHQHNFIKLTESDHIGCQGVYQHTCFTCKTIAIQGKIL